MKQEKIDLMSLFGDNQKTDCFAYSDNPGRPCSALIQRNCRNCPFYKTNGKMAKEILLCSNRLKTTRSRDSNYEYKLFEHYASLTELV